MKKTFIFLIVLLIVTGLIINKNIPEKIVYWYSHYKAIRQIPQNIKIVLDALIDYNPSRNSYKNEDIQALVDTVHAQLIYRLNNVEYKDILYIASIGPELSRSFIDYRKKHHGFNRINQLKQIKGMTLLDIYDIITAIMMAYVTKEMGQIMNSAEELSK